MQKPKQLELFAVVEDFWSGYLRFIKENPDCFTRDFKADREAVRQFEDLDIGRVAVQ